MEEAKREVVNGEDSKINKVTKIAFTFEDGEFAAITAKNEDELRGLTCVAKSILCNREKDGNIESLICATKRQHFSAMGVSGNAQAIIGMSLAAIRKMIRTCPKEADRAGHYVALIDAMKELAGEIDIDQERLGKLLAIKVMSEESGVDFCDLLSAAVASAGKKD